MKKASGRSAEKTDIAYLRKWLWARFRWPAVFWFLAVLVFTKFRGVWADASPAEIGLVAFIAIIWFLAILIIPLFNYMIAAVLSPSQTYEDRPCYDIALTKMHAGNYLAARQEFLEILEDYPGDRFCYENLIEIMAFHMPDANDVERLLKRARMEVPPSMLKEFRELAEAYEKRVSELQNTEKKKINVDFIYDSEIPDSVLHNSDHS